ncbi:MAG: RNA-protein complex protein Nop10 [Nitrososphaerales archaeon]
MKPLLRKCTVCNLYTLKKACPKCGSQTYNPHPAKFSPDDKYARYRTIDRYKEMPSS